MIDLSSISAKQETWWRVIGSSNRSLIQAEAQRALTGCASALAVLVENLNEVGYPWAATTKLAAGDIEKNVRTIESTLGAQIPPVLSFFWQTNGGVSLVDLENYQHVNFWKDHGVHSPLGFCDGLHVDPCTREWADFICRDYFDWKEFNCQDESEEMPFLLSLSPDGYHKDNISGGGAYGVYVGSSWTPDWANFEWSGFARPATAPPGAPDFLTYLRTTILECAGFPAFLGSALFNPLKERLLQGVSLF